MKRRRKAKLSAKFMNASISKYMALTLEERKAFTRIFYKSKMNDRKLTHSRGKSI